MLLVEHGSTRRPDPMIGSASEAPSEHVTIEDGKMQSRSAHVLIGFNKYSDGCYPVLIEKVPHLSRTTIEGFLNSLLFNETDCRNQYKSHMAYHRMDLSIRTNHTFGSFLGIDSLQTDFEILLPDGQLDSTMDETFEVSYRKRTTTNILADIAAPAWGKICGRKGARVRVRANQNGVVYHGEFENLTEDYLSLRMGVNGALNFSPPLAQHHIAISADVESAMLTFMDEEPRD